MTKTLSTEYNTKPSKKIKKNNNQLITHSAIQVLFASLPGINYLSTICWIGWSASTRHTYTKNLYVNSCKDYLYNVTLVYYNSMQHVARLKFEVNGTIKLNWRDNGNEWQIIWCIHLIVLKRLIETNRIIKLFDFVTNSEMHLSKVLLFNLDVNSPG